MLMAAFTEEFVSGLHLNQTTQEWHSHRCGDEGREAQNLARVGAHGRAPLQTVSAAVYESPVVRFRAGKLPTRVGTRNPLPTEESLGAHTVRAEHSVAACERVQLAQAAN